MALSIIQSRELFDSLGDNYFENKKLWNAAVLKLMDSGFLLIDLEELSNEPMASCSVRCFFSKQGESDELTVRIEQRINGYFPGSNRKPHENELQMSLLTQDFEHYKSWLSELSAPTYKSQDVISPMSFRYSIATADAQSGLLNIEVKTRHDFNASPLSSKYKIVEPITFELTLTRFFK